MLTDAVEEVNEAARVDKVLFEFWARFCYAFFMTPGAGRFFIVIGILCVIFGVILNGNIQIPWIGKLPGDIWIKKENFSFYFPVMTCLIASVLLTLLFYLFRK